MAPDVLSRAVEPFFTTKPRGQGTGLGLSQVYGFVHQSGGFLRMESESGHGTQVRIYMPGSLRAQGGIQGSVQARRQIGDAVFCARRDSRR